jgi:hypothetical protein
MPTEQTATVKHRMRWFAVAQGERFPRTSDMRGQIGWDVVCSCGWDSKTGGAVRRYIEELIWEHKAGLR